jgi:cysteinyl-tRNA synthetase
MALDLLSRHWGTDVLDIHAGGVDLIFPHHEDEIAQSCAHTGQPDFARVWMHGEFMTLSGTKMSKRFGNFLTARDLREEGVDPGAVRLLIFNTHYRQPLDWSDESLGHAREGSRRLGELRDRLRERAAVGGADDRAYLPVVETFHRDFSAALDDDLNSPRGLAALFVFAREANRLMDEGKAPGRESLGVLDLADRVLDVMPTRSARVEVGGVAGDGAVGPAAPEVSEAPPVDANAADRWAVAWKQRRDRAKAARDYAEADRIRELLRRHGYEIRDSRAGSEVVRTR